MTQASEPRTPTLALPGVVSVGPTDAPGGGVVVTGAAAGWISPPGIAEWSHELSMIARADLSDAVREELGLTLPEHRIAKGRHPWAYKAAESAPLLGVTSDVVPRMIEKGIRVHTVGFDRVTGGLLYFAEGGKDAPVNVHGDLLEMISPALESGSSNADIERHLDRFIDRLLEHLSGGLLTEARVELANALPRLAVDARGLAGVDLDAFEAEAEANAKRSQAHEDGAKKLAAALEASNGAKTVSVPLFGEARREAQPAIEVLLSGEKQILPARPLWVVTGAIRAEVAPKAEPAKKVEPAKPIVEPVAAKPAAAAAKPAPAAAKPAESPKPAPVSAKPAAKAPTPVVGTPKVATTPRPAAATPKPAAAKAATPAVGTPAPKPAEAAKPAEAPKPAEPIAETKPAEAPAVVVSKPVVVIAPEPAPPPPPPPVEAKPEPAPAPPPVPVEVKPEPKPEPKPAAAEAKPEPKPEPKPAPAEAKPEPKPAAAEAKREPKPEPKPEKAAPIEKAKPAEPAPAPAQKSSPMLFVIIALVVIAALAFVFLKK